jgi:hypothetical protein
MMIVGFAGLGHAAFRRSAKQACDGNETSAKAGSGPPRVAAPIEAHDRCTVRGEGLIEHQDGCARRGIGMMALPG